MSRVRAIPVVDGKGDQLTVYEFEDGRFVTKTRKLKLDTGEVVKRLDGDTFVLASGERLIRVP